MEEIRTKRPGGRTFSFILGLVYLAGICIMAYPAVSDWRNRMHAGQAVQKYEVQVKELSEASVIEIDDRPTDKQQLLLLSTCSYHTEDGRFVVAAYRI